MQKLLFEALYRNNVLFVSLLMEYGASIEDLTDEQLSIICVKTMVSQTVMYIEHLPFDSHYFFRATMLYPSIRNRTKVILK